MTAIREKVNHVLTAKQTRDHRCHWPGCNQQVVPAKWGCRRHWFMLPEDLRRAIWRTYKIGQEIKATPSAEYVAVTKRVQNWIVENHPVEPSLFDEIKG